MGVLSLPLQYNIITRVTAHPSFYILLVQNKSHVPLTPKGNGLHKRMVINSLTPFLMFYCIQLLCFTLPSSPSAHIWASDSKVLPLWGLWESHITQALSICKYTDLSTRSNYHNNPKSNSFPCSVRPLSDQAKTPVLLSYKASLCEWYTFSYLWCKYDIIILDFWTRFQVQGPTVSAECLQQA